MKDIEKEVEKKIEEELENACCGKDSCKCNCCKSHGHTAGSNCVYCLGVIGAAVFFIAKTTTFWAGVLGFLKALVWPAFMVYELFKFLIK